MKPSRASAFFNFLEKIGFSFFSDDFQACHHGITGHIVLTVPTAEGRVKKQLELRSLKMKSKP
jgi:hypothetical protein